MRGLFSDQIHHEHPQHRIKRGHITSVADFVFIANSSGVKKKKIYSE